MGIKTAEGKQNFKTCLHFLNFKLSSPNGILPTLSGACNSQIPHAICSKGYLITFGNGSKGNQRPFCKLQEGIRLPHAIHFYFRGLPDPGSRSQKGIGSRIRIRNTAFNVRSGSKSEFKTGSAKAESSGSCGSGSTARLVSSVIEIDCSAKPVNLDSLVRRAWRIPALGASDHWQSSDGGRMKREEGEKSSASHLGKKGLRCQAVFRMGLRS
jgi:hypothetical protein